MNSTNNSELKNARNDKSLIPEEASKVLIYFGYLFAGMGGLFGILIGYYIFSQKKNMQNEKGISRFTEFDRKQGKVMIVMGTVSMVLITIVNIVLM